MVVTSEVVLPQESELTVNEVNLSMSTLRAGSFHLGKFCEKANNEFMLCRTEEGDPRKCVEEGKQVTACTHNFFQKVKGTCFAEFNQYAHCIDQSSGDFAFDKCRNTQAVYDKCMLDKMGLERPGFGYFCEARVHDSKRPKPLPEPKVHYPDATPGLPDTVERKSARFGSRYWWMTE